MSLHSINHEQKLYVLKHGEWLSCLGFEVAARKAKAVAKWMGTDPPSDAIADGTEEGYAEYSRIMEAGELHYRSSGKCCDAELHPKLKGKEGHWVWVETEDEEIRIFKVGKSTGWFPCHLEIVPPDMSGGSSVRHTERLKRVELLPTN